MNTRRKGSIAEHQVVKMLEIQGFKTVLSRQSHFPDGVSYDGASCIFWECSAADTPATKRTRKSEFKREAPTALPVPDGDAVRLYLRYQGTWEVYDWIDGQLIAKEVANG